MRILPAVERRAERKGFNMSMPFSHLTQKLSVLQWVFFKVKVITMKRVSYQIFEKWTKLTNSLL